MQGFFDNLLNNLFSDMASSYETRNVDRYEKNDLIVDTAAVTDSPKPFETAISHREYNNADWIVVECYSTKEEALNGHKLWVKIMTSKSLPDEIRDVSECSAAQLKDLVGDKWRIKKRQK